jgi:hypothetical protein
MIQLSISYPSAFVGSSRSMLSVEPQMWAAKLSVMTDRIGTVISERTRPRAQLWSAAFSENRGDVTRPMLAPGQHFGTVTQQWRSNEMTVSRVRYEPTAETRLHSNEQALLVFVERGGYAKKNLPAQRIVFSLFPQSTLRRTFSVLNKPHASWLAAIRLCCRRQRTVAWT